jgi:hypothetical protein
LEAEWRAIVNYRGGDPMTPDDDLARLANAIVGEEQRRTDDLRESSRDLTERLGIEVEPNYVGTEALPVHDLIEWPDGQTSTVAAGFVEREDDAVVMSEAEYLAWCESEGVMPLGPTPRSPRRGWSRAKRVAYLKRRARGKGDPDGWLK